MPAPDPDPLLSCIWDAKSGTWIVPDGTFVAGAEVVAESSRVFFISEEARMDSTLEDRDGDCRMVD